MAKEKTDKNLFDELLYEEENLMIKIEEYCTTEQKIDNKIDQVTE